MRDHLGRRGALLSAILAILAVPPSEGAIPGNGTSLTTFTEESSTAKVYHSSWVSQRLDVSRTRITASDPHGAVVYDQTFDLPFADPAVQAAAATARQAIVAAAAPLQPIITGPTLQSHIVAISDRQSVTQETGRTPGETKTMALTVGPAVLCTVVATTAGQGVPPSCDPLALPAWINFGADALSTLVVRQIDITQTITTTDTTRTTEEYTLTSTAAGTDTAQIPALSDLGLLALGLGLAAIGVFRLRAGGIGCLLLALLAGTAAERATAQTITLASRTAPGLVDDSAGGASAPLNTSSDGRYTLFRSQAGNLVPGQATRNVGYNLFIHDAAAGTVLLVNHVLGSPTTTGNQQAASGLLSANGQYVVFLSGATDLVSGFVNSGTCQGANGGEGYSSHIFLFDRVSGGIVLVSHKAGSASTAANSCSDAPAISDDGRFVVFESTANDLVAGQSGANGIWIYLFDRDNPDSTLLVSHRSGFPVDPGTLPPPKPWGSAWVCGSAPSISGDGAYVSYFSEAVDLVAGQTGHSGVFLYDRSTGANSVVSRTAGTTNHVSADPLQPAVGAGEVLPSALSSDGRYVAFASGGTDLVTGQIDTNGKADLFLFDRTLGTNVLVSHVAGSAATAASLSFVETYGRYAFSASSNGAWVAFGSQATSLVAGATGSGQLVYLWEQATGNVQLVSRQAGSTTAGRSAVTGPVVSGEGRYVGYTSLAADLVAGQVASGNNDAFLFDRTTGTAALVSHRAGAPATAGSGGAASRTAISRDGSRVVYGSAKTDLVAGVTDANGWPDAFSYAVVTGTNSLVSRRDATLLSATEGVESYAYHQPSSSVTADGRYVVFASSGAHLAPGQSDTNGALDVFLFDKVALSTILVSRKAGTTATAGSGTSDRPVISADGLWVAFRSTATDLVAGQVEPIVGANVFLFDRTTGAMLLVSHYNGVPGRAGNRDSDLPVLSADGRFVAYESTSTDLASLQDDTNDASDVFLYDRTTGANTLVSHVPASAAKGAAGASNAPSLSADGRFVAFASSAADLVAGSDANGKSDVFLYDRTTGNVTLVSHAPGAATTAAGDASLRPVISADGNFAVYASTATNLVAGQVDTNAERDLFLHDRVAGTNVLVSHATGLGATAGNGLSDGSSISADGRFVAYVSLSTNLVPGQVKAWSTQDVFLYDRTSGLNTLVSHTSSSAVTSGNAASFDATLSADGRTVAFTSASGDLVAGQTNPHGSIAVFLHDAATGANSLLSRSTSGPLVSANSDSFHPLLSADGKTILFASLADDLDPLVLDANNFRDVYLTTRP